MIFSYIYIIINNKRYFKFKGNIYYHKMSSIDKLYNITNVNTLIDLNENINNFDCNFTITNIDDSDNGKFKLSIVSQEELDDGDIQYRNITGSISGNINSKNGIYENYIILIKSDNDCKCHIKTEFRELSDQEIQKEEMQQKEIQKEEIQQKLNKTPEKPSDILPQPKPERKKNVNIPTQKEEIVENSFFSVKNIFIIVFIIGLGIFIYIYFFKDNNPPKNTNTSKSPDPSIEEIYSAHSTPVRSSPSISEIIKTPVNNSSVMKPSPGTVRKNKILKKLKNTKLK